MNLTFASAYSLSEKAIGHSISTEWQIPIGQKNTVGVELSHVFTQSREIPENLQASNVWLRDYSNVNPLGPEFSPFYWSKTSFPSIRLHSKPSRFFNYNITVKYFHTKFLSPKTDLKFGAGLAWSYHDEMKLLRLLDVEILELIIPPTQKFDYFIPVYVYNTYWDIAFIPEIQYAYHLSRRLDVCLKNQLFWYPKSKNFVLVNGLTLKVAF